MKKQAKIVLIIFLLGLTLMTNSFGQKTYPPEIKSSKVETYKSIDSVDLKLWIFNPEDHKISDNRAVVVFFFGGGWKGGSPSQFVHQCEYLSERGMVAITADYRVATRNDVKANKCVTDAKSAVRWIREHADELGIDPDRIAAGGGSAGGHIAAATGTLTGFEEVSEDMSISSIPDAMVLFNPALILAPLKGNNNLNTERLKGLEERLGVSPISLSPYHHISKNIPPTIIFHGRDDTTVPFNTVELFEEEMKSKGNRCELNAYEGASHGFFNYGRNDNKFYPLTMEKLDAFFVSLKYLDPR
ncbi:MAG: alpha/beta hydrolase [Bacteroidales bacterium]|nr:alpha/beta hydrolase [Bacteroidales bacterium]